LLILCNDSFLIAFIFLQKFRCGQVPGSSLPLLEFMFATRTVYLTCLSQEGQWVETIDREKEEESRKQEKAAQTFKEEIIFYCFYIKSKVRESVLLSWKHSW